MNADFPRILTLLRKEKGISQKEAAEKLNISQALLSHYEKGIRECGLDFLVRCSELYSVSCDYLLGRSPERSGAILNVEDIPDPESFQNDNIGRGSLIPVLNKKLIQNSNNILFDILTEIGSKGLTNEVSAYLMMSVYKMFRHVYSANPKNAQAIFNLPEAMFVHYVAAAMDICEGNVSASLSGQKLPDIEPVGKDSVPEITTETLMARYPQFYSSLLNLIQNSESRMIGKKQTKSGRGKKE